MGIRIISTGSYLPQTIESVQPPSSSMGTENGSLSELFSGAREHRTCSEHETTTYIGIQAARNALTKGNIDPQSIDAVLCYSEAEDNQIPKDVYGIINEIGCHGTMAWTIDTACASFLSHLNCANALSLTGRKRILIIDSMNWVNRAFAKDTRTDGPGSLVGDGAGAVVVESVPGRGSIIDAIEKTSTFDFDFITMSNAQVTGKRESISFTKKNKIIHRAFSILPETAQELLCRNGLTSHDVTWTITHQPGLNAMRKWHELLKIPVKKNLNTFEAYGNMSAANIPVTLDHFLCVEPKIKRGDIILSFTAGAGIHCATALIEY